MASYSKKELFTYIGIVVGLILLAVIVMTFLGNERRKGEISGLKRQIKEKFSESDKKKKLNNSDKYSHLPN
tara:strand:+ start:284 stop:496 length:213 start_codon:yes stop_codon:yes gene_type:complete